MSQVIFNNRINMPTAATPSTGGYTVGYDLDGVIKQKDSLGNVTPLFSSSSENLAQTLQLGNDSGAYSIVMGTGTSIRSGGAKSYILLDSNGGILIYATASGSTSSVIVGNGAAILRNVDSQGTGESILRGGTYSLTIATSTQSVALLQSKTSFSISHRDDHSGNPFVNVLSIGSSYDGDLIENKAFVHINSKNANTLAGVRNSAIIGGSGLTASVDDTVYLGNSVNINNEYTLPSADGSSGQALVTDGAGTVYWSSVSGGGGNQRLDEVLQVGNNSGIYSIAMGTATSIYSSNGSSAIFLDDSLTESNILISSNGSLTDKGYIRINEDVISIGATSGNVTIGDRKGLVYSEDYSPTFVNNSLVTKQYVDSLSNSAYIVEKVAYVDPANGNDTTALVNRIDKPYQTVAKATSGLTSSYSFSASDRGLVHLKKGLYSTAIVMFDNIDYYCEPDVLFTGNGFTDLGAAVNSSIMGYADFISAGNANLVPLDITRESNVNFEFRRIDNLSVAFKISNLTGTSNINIKGESIRTRSDLGRGILIGNQAGSQNVSSNIRMEIKNQIAGAYDVIDIRPRFSGTVDIKCPAIYCDSNINTIQGPQADAQHVLAVRSASASVVIRGDLYEITSTDAGGINSAVYASPCNLKIYGNIDGSNCVGLRIEGSTGSILVQGDIKSRKESVINNSNGISVRISDSLIKTDGIGAVPYAININCGTMSSTYIHNSRIYNSVQDSGMIIMSTTNSTFGIYNSLAYSPGTASGNFIYCAGTVSVGIHNTRCNKDNSEMVEDLFAPSGFIYDDRFYMEGF